MEMEMYTRILADSLRAHECGIDCEYVTTAGMHVLYPAAPTIDAGRYQYDRNVGMTRREYRESGQDETRECRVWASTFNADGIRPGSRRERREYGAAAELYYSGRESSLDEGRI